LGPAAERVEVVVYQRLPGDVELAAALVDLRGVVGVAHLRHQVLALLSHLRQQVIATLHLVDSPLAEVPIGADLAVGLEVRHLHLVAGQELTVQDPPEEVGEVTSGNGLFHYPRRPGVIGKPVDVHQQVPGRGQRRLV